MELWGFCMMFTAIGVPTLMIGVILDLFADESIFSAGCICVGVAFLLIAFMAFFLCVFQEGMEMYRG